MAQIPGIEKLISLSGTIHRLSNSMNALNFAAGKGWVDENERLVLKRLKSDAEAAREEADRVWKELETSRPEELRQYLLGLHDRLKTLWEEFQTSGRSPEIPKGEFNSSIIPGLLAALASLIAGMNPDYDRYRALSVADQILNRSAT